MLDRQLDQSIRHQEKRYPLLAIWFLSNFIPRRQQNMYSRLVSTYSYTHKNTDLLTFVQSDVNEKKTQSVGTTFCGVSGVGEL